MPTRPQALPAIDLQRLDGGSVQLTSDLEGRPALISLWATWCESCATEFEALNKLHDRARARGGRVIAVSVGEKQSDVSPFVTSHGLRYEQLLDPTLAFADALGQKRVPATLVVDGKGAVVFVGKELDAAAIGALDRLLQ